MTDEGAASELGTREHWRETYQTELSNFRASGGEDAGECWFGEDVQATAVNFTLEAATAHCSAGLGARVLDLGCGNGLLCVALAKAGFTRVSGVDYVEESVALAREVAAAAGCAVSFSVDDLLHSSLPPSCADVLVDKGTFDAVGLSAPRGESEALHAAYVAAALRLLPPAGLLIITSCNSTADELAATFCGGPGARFTEVSRVKTYPVFTFGGHSGARVATLAFQRCGD